MESVAEMKWNHWPDSVEYAQWERLDVLKQKAGIAEGRIAIFYLEAVSWTDRFS